MYYFYNCIQRFLMDRAEKRSAEKWNENVSVLIDNEIQ
jgi:hypothetical protein